MNDNDEPLINPEKVDKLKEGFADVLVEVECNFFTALEGACSLMQSITVCSAMPDVAVLRIYDALVVELRKQIIEERAEMWGDSK